MMCHDGRDTLLPKVCTLDAETTEEVTTQLMTSVSEATSVLSSGIKSQEGLPATRGSHLPRPDSRRPGPCLFLLTLAQLRS